MIKFVFNEKEFEINCLNKNGDLNLNEFNKLFDLYLKSNFISREKEILNFSFVINEKIIITKEITLNEEYNLSEELYKLKKINLIIKENKFIEFKDNKLPFEEYKNYEKRGYRKMIYKNDYFVLGGDLNFK